MFESYENPVSRRVLKLALVVLFGLALFVTVIQLTCRTPTDSEGIIQSSASLTAHDRFCMSLPRPVDFQLRYRMVGGNSNTTAISYTFTSSLPFDEVRDFFSQELPLDGWVLTDQYLQDMTPVGKQMTYKKEQYEITIGHESAGSPAQYYLYCAKKHS